MLDHRDMDDEFDELIAVQSETPTAADRPEPDRSVEVAEDLYRRDRAKGKPLEHAEG